nr:MAG TPA: hypothetical protein [Caudoviricetes sp.]
MRTSSDITESMRAIRLRRSARLAELRSQL